MVKNCEYTLEQESELRTTIRKVTKLNCFLRKVELRTYARKVTKNRLLLIKLTKYPTILLKSVLLYTRLCTLPACFLRKCIVLSPKPKSTNGNHSVHSVMPEVKHELDCT